MEECLHGGVLVLTAASPPLCVFMHTQHLLCQPFKDALCSLFSKLYLTLASFLVRMLYFPDLHLEKILDGAFCTELR